MRGPAHLQRELEVIFRAVTDASLLCRFLRAQASSQEGLGIMTKSDASPVTCTNSSLIVFTSPLMQLTLVADISAAVVINSAIQKAFPGDCIIGEEDATEVTDALLARLREAVASCGVALDGVDVTCKEAVSAILQGVRSDGELKRYWTVDPIDGTRGFIRGDQYAVCIALVDGETQLPVLCALGCPNLLVEGETGVVLIAIKAHGVFKCRLGEDLDGLTLVPPRGLQDDLARAIFTGALESSHTNPSEIARVKAALDNCHPTVQMDSQCKYGILALGRAHVYYRRHGGKDREGRPVDLTVADYREAIWDNAPGYLFVTEAGGQVTDFANNPLRFPPTRHFRVVGGILASVLTSEQHAMLIETVGRLCLDVTK